jgi:ABC-type nitrate/sulfonate/bicarbonate transport system permease component
LIQADDVPLARAGAPERPDPAAWLKQRPNLIRLAAVALFFLFWEWAARDMSPLFMATPSGILAAAHEMIADGELLQACLQSIVPLSIGLGISIVGGIAIGIAIGEVWWLEYTLDPFLNALYAIPRVALVPLIMLWAGLGIGGKVTILVSIAIFPVIFNTYAGIKDVRGNLIEIGQAYCATPSQLFLKITLPASIPYIMAGIRLAVGLAIIGMVVGEFFTAMSGLGGLIVKYANTFVTAKVFVPTVLIGIVGVGLTQLVLWIERRLSGWRTLERERTL